MKVEKIVMFLIVVVALGGGLYLFQKNKQEKELVAHNTLKFQQMTEAAKTSSPVGLLAMASTLNKYHQIKGHYPEKLLDLYPEFIPEKPFILTLNWKYDLKNGKYLLRRKIEGQNTVASIGPDLKLKMERDDRPKQQEAVASVFRPDLHKTKKIKTTAPEPLKAESNIKEDTKRIEIVEKEPLPNIQKALSSTKTKDETTVALNKPSAKIVKKALKKNEEYLLSFDRGRFYIWKTKDGIIGFSDVKYPDEKQLTIYQNQGWIEYGVNQDTIKTK